MNKGENKFLDPEKILSQLDFQPGMKVADFGCGHGYFTIPLAKALGEQGHVFALDAQAQALEVIKEKTKLFALSNVETARCNLELNGHTKIKNGYLDIVFLANTLYQSNKKKEIIEEAHRALKDNGQLVVIDWLTENAIQLKEWWPMDKEKITALIETAGFKLSKELEVGAQHYGMLFIKNLK